MTKDEMEEDFKKQQEEYDQDYKELEDLLKNNPNPYFEKEEVEDKDESIEDAYERAKGVIDY